MENMTTAKVSFSQIQHFKEKGPLCY